jgi:hypothetical protein
MIVAQTTDISYDVNGHKDRETVSGATALYVQSVYDDVGLRFRHVFFSYRQAG